MLAMTDSFVQNYLPIALHSQLPVKISFETFVFKMQYPLTSCFFLNALLFFDTLPVFFFPGVPALFIYSFNSYSSFQTWMKRDLGQKSAPFLEASLTLFCSPYELGGLILRLSLVLRNNLCIALIILLRSLVDCGLPEDRNFVLLTSILDEFAIRLGILGSLVNSWQFTLWVYYSLRAAHWIILRI